MRFDWNRFAQDVETAIYRQHSSLTSAAQRLRIAPNTLRKLTKGEPVSASVRIKISSELNLDESNYTSNGAAQHGANGAALRPNGLAVAPAAANGAASLDQVGHPLGDLVGDYLLVRRQYAARRALVESAVSISLDVDDGSLHFTETNPYVNGGGEKKVAQLNGCVHVSAYLATMHLVSIVQGGVRMVTLWKPCRDDMLGVVLSQTPNRNFYSPAVSPVLLRPVPDSLLEPCPHAISEDDPRFGPYDRHLSRAEMQFFFSSSPHGVDKSFATPE